MDNTINNDIIQKVVIQKTAIYKAIAMLPPIETKDLWEEKNLIEHQKNYENKNVSETNDTMNETKTNSTPNDWRDITDPKLRKKMYLKNYRKVNRDKIKKYREVNKDKLKVRRNLNRDREKEQQRIYYKNNKDKILLKQKIRRETNNDEVKTITKNWRKNNKIKLNERSKAYHLANKNNIQYKLRRSLRGRLFHAINDNFKNGSAVKDLGCTIDELKTYLESKFQPGMSWDNWTTDGWHIDHIKPLASFDLTDRNQFLEACHYTNLQPLWAKDNLIKGSSVL